VQGCSLDSAAPVRFAVQVHGQVPIRILVEDRHPQLAAQHPGSIRGGIDARGYWQAFQRVTVSESKALAGENVGTIVRADHRNGPENCSSHALLQA